VSDTVQMPRLSDSMEEGKVLKWMKKAGDKVNRGEVIAEIETDKATMELESPFAGVLLEIQAEVGTSVPVGEPIAVIGDEDEAGDAEAATPSDAEPAPEPKAPAQEPPAEAAESDKPADEDAPHPQQAGASQPPVPGSSGVQQPSPRTQPAGGRVKASPLARKIAQEKNVDLNEIKGTGPGGRIMLGDVEGYLEAQGEASTPPGGVETGEETGVLERAPVEGGTTFPLSKMRRAIAKNMAQAKREAPHFYVRVAVETMAAEQLKDALSERYSDRRISWTAIILKAVALALREVPRLNATYLEVDDAPSVRVFNEVHLGVAVAVDEGLVEPVLRNAHIKPIPQIAKELSDLAKRTREGKLKGEELTGATFSVSNLGMAGVEEFAAVIPPGRAGILAVGNISEEVVVQRGQIQVVHRLRATLSADHRVVDGWGASEYLQAFKRYLEQPTLMLLD